MFVNLGGESEGDCVLRVPSPRDKCSMLLALEISAMVSRRTLTLPVPDSLLPQPQSSRYWSRSGCWPC